MEIDRILCKQIHEFKIIYIVSFTAAMDLIFFFLKIGCFLMAFDHEMLMM